MQFTYSDNNFTFIMTTIDIFTRKAFCKLLRKKTAVETTKKLKDILQECGQKPDTILFDSGREWHNKHVNRLLDEFGIKKYEPDTSIHALYVERFNRTLQKLIYMHMDKNKSYSFYKSLPSIVKLYNNRKHRGLPKLTPNEAEMEENHDKILDWNEKKRSKPKYRINQIVRASKMKSRFHRGYGPQYTTERFKIIGIKKNLPKPLYTLESIENKDVIEGKFYESQIFPNQSNV